jgi:nicotinate-nucleotide adenylyltransferase
MGKLRTKRIGVMGGTFDPIHYGHLFAAEESRNVFQLDEVVFVPTGNPPHKEEGPNLPAEDRYRMTVMATAGNPTFRVSRVETDREGLSYTLDTLRELRGEYGKNTVMYFITGADAILEIMTWKEPEQILEECCIIAATRPGYDLARLEKALPFVEQKRRKTDPRVIVLEIPALAISSTDIRERVAAGRPIRYLVPEVVVQFIAKSGFYR